MDRRTGGVIIFLMVVSAVLWAFMAPATIIFPDDPIVKALLTFFGVIFLTVTIFATGTIALVVAGQVIMKIDPWTLVLLVVVFSMIVTAILIS